MYGVTDRAFCVESLIFSSLHPNGQLLIALKSSSRVLHIPGLAHTRIDVSELLFCRISENAAVSQFLVNGLLRHTEREGHRGHRLDAMTVGYLSQVEMVSQELLSDCDKETGDWRIELMLGIISMMIKKF